MGSTPEAGTGPASTEGRDYAERLQRLRGARWKRWLNVQAPYRWNVRRLQLGRTLDVGCGLGRNLGHLDGQGVGVDHNPTSVGLCREAGLVAYTADEFLSSPEAAPEAFDSLLAAHLVEHLSPDAARELLKSYLPFVRPGGRVVLITPQERGYASDSTHVWFVGFAEAAALCEDVGLTVERSYSFPLPRAMGKRFTYNEFVTVAHKG